MGIITATPQATMAVTTMPSQPAPHKMAVPCLTTAAMENQQPMTTSIL